MRSRSASAVIGVSSSQTPTIIIRLTSLSIRSQAVSTRDMRSVAGAGIEISFGCWRVRAGWLT